MEDAVAAQARERVTRWIEESRALLGLLPDLLDDHGKSEQAEKESERLRRDAELLRKEAADVRKETGDLRKEIVDLRKENADLRREYDELQKAMDELKKETETLRSEKEEAAGAFARLLDTVQSTNQIAQKLGVTKSPFARHPATVAPNPAPHD